MFRVISGRALHGGAREVGSSRPPMEKAMSSLTQCHRSPNSHSAPTSVWLSRGMDALKQVWDFLERAAAGRRALRDLSNADDHMLKDIGLDRSALRDAAAEPFYRDPTSLLADRADEARPRRTVRRGRAASVPYY
jgi:uncharacterized protein YjiS (DUF1127 family)